VSSVTQIIDRLVAPSRYWKRKLGKDLRRELVPARGPLALVKEALPPGALPLTVPSRVGGLASLSRLRLVILAEWAGGTIARKAKASGRQALILSR
jgi:hypothetical protein